MSQPTGPEDTPGDDGTVPLTTASWSFDFWRMIGCSAFSAVLWSGVLWLAANGGITNSWGTKTATASSLFAGIAAAVMSMMMAVLMHSSSRRDGGFRDRGLVPLLTLGSLSASVVQLLVMLTWPPIIGDALTPGTVAAEIGADSASTLVAGVFVLAANAAFLALFLLVKVAFAELRNGWGPFLKILVLIAAVGAVFFYGLQGATIFDRPASETSVSLWVVMAVVAFIALAVVGLWMTRATRARMTALGR